MLLLIVGPSGVGKNTVANKLIELYPDVFRYAVSVTTRNIRKGEVEGQDYFFVSFDEFEKMDSEGLFVEYETYQCNKYGTLRSEIEKDGVNILIVETNGALRLSKEIKDSISVFLLPPTLMELERRLRNRGTNTEEEIRARLEFGQKEIELTEMFNFGVINSDIDITAEDIYKIVFRTN